MSNKVKTIPDFKSLLFSILKPSLDQSFTWKIDRCRRNSSGNWSVHFVNENDYVVEHEVEPEEIFVFLANMPTFKLPEDEEGFQKNQSGIKLIEKERQRQIEEEGWTPEHDDKHVCGELAVAGGCYAISVESDYPTYAPNNWPFEKKWWKPKHNKVQQLVKAGALIAAEIDRLNRRKCES